jgi:sugar phosphate isomerase/epimerase
MHLSAMLTSLPLSFVPALEQVAALGFSHVDVVALAERPEAHVEALADSGLLLSCAAVGRGLPEGHTLDAVSTGGRRAALDSMKQQVADAARLGATHCYVIPGMDSSAEGLVRFGEACGLLADFAGQRMVKLCVEHIPGRALPTVAATLDWLERLGHNNLSLLLDIGHCLISREDPTLAVQRAGRRLGYVHLDDNDGTGDLHWPLLTGQLEREVLDSFLRALKENNYRGALALELNPQNADPVEALRQGKKVVEELVG